MSKTSKIKKLNNCKENESMNENERERNGKRELVLRENVNKPMKIKINKTG